MEGRLGPGGRTGAFRASSRWVRVLRNERGPGQGLGALARAGEGPGGRPWLGFPSRPSPESMVISRAGPSLSSQASLPLLAPRLGAAYGLPGPRAILRPYGLHTEGPALARMNIP